MKAINAIAVDLQVLAIGAICKTNHKGYGTQSTLLQPQYGTLKN